MTHKTPTLTMSAPMHLSLSITGWCVISSMHQYGTPGLMGERQGQVLIIVYHPVWSECRCVLGHTSSQPCICMNLHMYNHVPHFWYPFDSKLWRASLLLVIKSYHKQWCVNQCTWLVRIPFSVLFANVVPFDMSAWIASLCVMDAFVVTICWPLPSCRCLEKGFTHVHGSVRVVSTYLLLILGTLL